MGPLDRGRKTRLKVKTKRPLLVSNLRPYPPPSGRY